MGEERLALSQKERDRLKELHTVLAGQLKVGEAAKRLSVSPRQVRRLLRKVREQGDRGVIHGLRGLASNRRLPERLQRQALKVLGQAVYRDFGPTLSAEHLERRGIKVSRETLRHWMVGAGLWKPKARRVEEPHTWRERRSCWGELVLMDTSEHEWLEARRPKFCLIAMIDDATSRVWARFTEHDTTEENLWTLKGWLTRYGRPLALYTDRDSIFVTTPSSVREQIEGVAPTHFGEVLAELGIEWIPAYSPQAKGRVERLFETLQDRLLKELRVAQVKTLSEANRFLEEVFLPFWQERFTTPPREAQDAHRSLGGLDLESVLSLRETRLVTGDYTLAYKGRRWAVPRPLIVPGLRKSRVVVEQRLDGTLWVRFRKHRLKLEGVNAAAASPLGLRPPVLAAKTKPRAGLHQSSKPSPDHPWRQSWSKRSLLLCGEADISTLR